MTTTPPPATPPSSGDPPRRPLYDPTTGRFNIRRLQREMFARGWPTVGEFVVGLGCGRTAVYTALGGKAVRNRTTRAILEGLQRREPRQPLLE